MELGNEEEGFVFAIDQQSVEQGFPVLHLAPKCSLWMLWEIILLVLLVASAGWGQLHDWVNYLFLVFLSHNSHKGYDV